MDFNSMPDKEELKPANYVRKKMIFSFAVFAVIILLAIYGWKQLNDSPRQSGMLMPLRLGLEANEKVNNIFFSPANRAKEYPLSKAAKKVRINGSLGLRTPVDTPGWKLYIYPQEGKDLMFQLTMPDIYSLPKKDIVFNFKCIEGWSQVSHWGGATFLSFLKKYKLGTHSGNEPDVNNPGDLYKYVGLMTPDSQYYVGIDMKSMLQDQTILCYEMNNKPLPAIQGYPLRLIIPVKYGIKHLKRIGYIYFSDSRPRDYWYERGYDYDSAL